MKVNDRVRFIGGSASYRGLTGIINQITSTGHYASVNVDNRNYTVYTDTDNLELEGK